jgi:excinuclease ABC subunit C
MKKRTIPDNVVEKLKKLPAKPGCYIYRDVNGDVLYVGKAVSLRNRVRSYFQPSTKHSRRIARMVAKVEDLETMVVDSELEALVLECNLIKTHRPPYNVRLRDDKSYPFIVVTNERFPRVLFTRKVRRDGAKYYGPYTNVGSVRETLQLLHHIFPLIPCGKSWSGKAVQRPCLYYHLNQCMAPCAGLSDADAYAQVVAKVEMFLSGKQDVILADLRTQMEKAAEDLDFERAAELRDQVKALEDVQQRQKVLSTDEEDQDVIAVVKDERGAAIQMLYIRGGKLIGQRQYILDGAADSAPSEAIGEFVKQYYADAPEVPREILLPVEIEERKIVQQWLKQRRGSAVTVGVPQGGEKMRLVDLAAANAEQALATFSMEMDRKEQFAETALVELQEAIGLAQPPARIEGYDISNIQGTAPVGSMVVVENAEPAKQEYRRFKIRYHPESPDDFAMMNEVITRRLRAYLSADEKFSALPDLILIDGGKGQLAAALAARDALGLTVPMVGLAKKMEILYVPELRDEGSGIGDQGSGNRVQGSGNRVQGSGFRVQGSRPAAAPGPSEGSDLSDATAGREPQTLAPRPETPDPSPQAPAPASRVPRPDSPLPSYAFHAVELPLTSPGLVLLRRLRDEAHRFAITFHRKIRDKRMTGSALEEVPGIGPRRRRVLLRMFGSVEGIRRASVEELSAVPTMTKRLAEQVKEYLTQG